MWNNETLVIKRVDPGLYKIVDSKKAIRRIVGKDFLDILYLQLNDFTERICKTTSGLYIRRFVHNMSKLNLGSIFYLQSGSNKKSTRRNGKWSKY